MRSDRYRQQNLFEERRMRPQLDASLRGKLSKLVEELLIEAADRTKGINATGSIVEGAADDEDHR